MKKISTGGIIAFLLAAILFTACATAPSGNGPGNDIVIERIDPAKVVVDAARLESTADGLMLRGRVENRLAGRGPIPGHLHIELIGPAGETLKNADVVYRKKGVKGRLPSLTCQYLSS